jgi:hypothetical protein
MKRKRLRPGMVADACLEAAWRDDIPDQVRMHLEHAHDVIHWMMARSVASAKVLEIVEAELASMKYPLLGDNDDPGMSL